MIYLLVFIHLIKTFWESFVLFYIYYPIDILMVVTDYLLNNINKYVESSSIKVKRVKSIFNFCLRSLYDNTSQGKRIHTCL